MRVPQSFAQILSKFNPEAIEGEAEKLDVSDLNRLQTRADRCVPHIFHSSC
jgi:hypothetical protein